MYKATLELEYSGGGYLWSIEPTDNITVRSVNYKIESDTNAVGGGGTQIFTLVSAIKGKQTVKAVYQRPWEAIPLKTKEIELDFNLQYDLE